MEPEDGPVVGIVTIQRLAEHHDTSPEELGLVADDWSPDEKLRAIRVGDDPPTYRLERFHHGRRYPTFDEPTTFPLEDLPPRLHGLEAGRISVERLNEAMDRGSSHSWWDEYERLLEEFDAIISSDHLPRQRDMIPFAGGAVRVILDGRGREWLLRESEL